VRIREDISVQFRLRTLLVALAVIPAVLWLIFAMWERDQSVDIELHFEDEVEDEFQVVFEVHKTLGSIPKRVKGASYQIDVPRSRHVKLASDKVLERWHRIFVVTPRHKKARRAFETPRSYSRSGRTAPRRTPDGAIVTESTEEGSQHVLFLELQK
jgi:hypothetical protein